MNCTGYPKSTISPFPSSKKDSKLSAEELLMWIQFWAESCWTFSLIYCAQSSCLLRLKGTKKKKNCVCCFYLCPVQSKLHDTNLHRAKQSNTYDNVYVLLTWKQITGKKSYLIHHNASAGRIFLLPGHSKQHNNAGIIQNATVCGWASHIFR